MSAGSCACSPSCRSTRSPGWKRCEGAEINEAKKVLATEATALAHGREAAEAAAETARQAFEEGAAAETLPTHHVPEAQLAAGIPLLQLLTATGLVASNGEARRLIQQNGVRLNDEVVAQEGKVGLADLRDGAAKLSVGKKRHWLIKPESGHAGGVTKPTRGRWFAASRACEIALLRYI